MPRRGARSRAARRAVTARFAHAAETERHPVHRARHEARAFVSLALAHAKRGNAKSTDGRVSQDLQTHAFSAATLLDYHASDGDGVLDERRSASRRSACCRVLRTWSRAATFVPAKRLRGIIK